MKHAQLRAVGGQKLRNMFCPKKAMKIHALVIVVHKRAKISRRLPIAETLEKQKLLNSSKQKSMSILRLRFWRDFDMSSRREVLPCANEKTLLA